MNNTKSPMARITTFVAVLSLCALWIAGLALAEEKKEEKGKDVKKTAEEGKGYPLTFLEPDGEKKLEPGEAYIKWRNTTKTQVKATSGKAITILFNEDSTLGFQSKKNMIDGKNFGVLAGGDALVSFNDLPAPMRLGTQLGDCVTAKATFLVQTKPYVLAVLDGELTFNTQDNKKMAVKAGHSIAQVMGKGLVDQPTDAVTKKKVAQMAADMKNYKPGKTSAKDEKEKK